MKNKQQIIVERIIVVKMLNKTKCLMMKNINKIEKKLKLVIRIKSFTKLKYFIEIIFLLRKIKDAMMLNKDEIVSAMGSPMKDNLSTKK
jgi:hypothetical protein